MRTPRMLSVLGLLAAMFCLLPFMGLDALAVGTSGDTGVIHNAIYVPSDTVPNSAGTLVVRYKRSNLLSDSRYAYITDGNTVSITVDTAYDLVALGTPADRSASAGETAVYVYWVENIGNATILIDLDTERADNQADSAWPVRNYRILYDLGNDSAVAADSGIGNVTLPAGASRQVLVTVYVPDTASMGESSHVVFRMSDRAPLQNGSSSGDAWQAGVPILNAASVNERDTQWDTVVTTVKGPKIKTGKAVYELTSGRSRPGDTLVFDITIDNDGNDSAYGLELIDAIPANTRYVPYSADSGIFLGNSGIAGTFTADSDILVKLDTQLSDVAQNFADSIPTAGGQYDTLPIRTIKWTFQSALGESNGDGTTVSPDFENGVYDNARVSFRVTIQ